MSHHSRIVIILTITIFSLQCCQWADWELGWPPLLLSDVQIPHGPGWQVLPVHPAVPVSLLAEKLTSVFYYESSNAGKNKVSVNEIFNLWIHRWMKGLKIPKMILWCFIVIFFLSFPFSAQIPDVPKSTRRGVWIRRSSKQETCTPRAGRRRRWWWWAP